MIAAGVFLAGIIAFYLNAHFKKAPEAAQAEPPRQKVYPAVKLVDQDRCYILNNPENLPVDQLVDREYYGGEWETAYVLYSKDGRWWWIPTGEKGTVHEASYEELKQVNFQAKDGPEIWKSAQKQ